MKIIYENHIVKIIYENRKKQLGKLFTSVPQPYLFS